MIILLTDLFFKSYFNFVISSNPSPSVHLYSRSFSSQVISVTLKCGARRRDETVSEMAKSIAAQDTGDYFVFVLFMKLYKFWI